MQLWVFYVVYQLLSWSSKTLLFSEHSYRSHLIDMCLYSYNKFRSLPHFQQQNKFLSLSKQTLIKFFSVYAIRFVQWEFSVIRFIGHWSVNWKSSLCCWWTRLRHLYHQHFAVQSIYFHVYYVWITHEGSLHWLQNRRRIQRAFGPY